MGRNSSRGTAQQHQGLCWHGGWLQQLVLAGIGLRGRRAVCWSICCGAAPRPTRANWLISWCDTAAALCVDVCSDPTWRPPFWRTDELKIVKAPQAGRTPANASQMPAGIAEICRCMRYKPGCTGGSQRRAGVSTVAIRMWYCAGVFE